MDLISVQFAPRTKEEFEEMVKWSIEGMKNENYFDPNVLGYKSTVKLLAASSNKRILYMPAQVVLMLESLAANPEATKLEVAVALRTVVNACQVIAQQNGIGEIYFLGTNEMTNQLASKHGFVEVPWKVFKMPAEVKFNEDIPQDSPQL